VYAPATLIIKALMVPSCYFTFHALKKVLKSQVLSMVIGSIFAELIMVTGYFLFACLLMGEGLAAAASIIGNLIQGGVGVTAGVPLAIVFESRNPFNKTNK